MFCLVICKAISGLLYLKLASEIFADTTECPAPIASTWMVAFCSLVVKGVTFTISVCCISKLKVALLVTLLKITV